MDERAESIATAQRPRDYAGLLWIFAASMLGFSLFCATSAIALSDPGLPTPIVIEANDIPDLAFSNFNAAAELTAEAFSRLVATETPTPIPTSTLTQTASSTASPTATRTLIPPTFTPTDVQNTGPIFIPPTFTASPRPTNTAVEVVPPTGTPIVQEPETETPVPEPPTDTPSP